MSYNGICDLMPKKSDGRRCEYCGRFDDDEAEHNCDGCGAFFGPSKLIDVTTFSDVDPRYLRVPA